MTEELPTYEALLKKPASLNAHGPEIRNRKMGEVIEAEQAIVNQEADTNAQMSLDLTRQKVDKLVEKCESGARLYDHDKAILLTPSGRIKFLQVMEQRGHGPESFCRVLGVLEKVALSPKTNDINKIKACNAYLARIRETFGVEATAKDRDPPPQTVNYHFHKGLHINFGPTPGRHNNPVRAIQPAGGSPCCETSGEVQDSEGWSEGG